MFLEVNLCMFYNLTGVMFMALKNRVRIGNSIDKKLFEELQELSDKTRIPMSRLLDEAIEDLVKKHQKKSSHTYK